ncbi:MAG: DUF3226 domain-containing protein [Rhizomicrobium sp.]|jgi:hypothetical protein
MRQHPKRMIVEGEDDKHAIVELMGHHTEWPDDKFKAPVWLEAVGSPEAILAEGFIPTKLDESGTTTLGVVFDADTEFDSRWRRTKQICEKFFPKVPEQIDPAGLILENKEGKRLGVWMMPDNKNHGMIETFLQSLIHERSAPLLAFAESVVVDARHRGAPCRECHIDKSEIHSWLAWQDPPGQALGRAITSMTLDPHSDSAKPFVEWFLNLYRLERK